MKFIREWPNGLNLVVVVITIITSVVITSRALVTRGELEAAIKTQEIALERACVTNDTKLKTSQAMQEKYFEEYIKNAAAWAADRAARKAVREYVQFTRTGKLPLEDND